MRRCKYCDTDLFYVGEYDGKFYWHCKFCDITFDEKDTKNSKGIMPVHSYDDNYYRSVKELISCSIFDLLYSLKKVRADSWTVHQTLNNLVKEQKEKDDKPGEINNILLSDYRQLTKIRKVLERIALDRMGYIPQKITEKYISELIALHEKSIKNKK